jgi:prepilin signal peptidase PulO-like enzyme (type II secretory pathway)
LDRVPILGWFGLRREFKSHGAGFWVRPLLIELALAVGLPWLYWREVAQQALLPDFARGLALPSDVLHLQYISHVVLIALMTVATFIDIDERLIPDEITVTGTLAGLLLAALAPWSLLPVLQVSALPLPAEFAAPLALPAQLAQALQPQQVYLQFLTFVSPHLWIETLAAVPPGAQLALALACYWLWIFAVLPRPWYGRHGLGRALGVATARMFRALRTPLPLVLLVFGTAGIVAVWTFGGANWAGLLTALVGLVGGGGIVWAVRLIGAAALRKEAMGFGDVLLMMMIGTFIGWQASLIVFFIAPFAGLVIGLLNLLVRRDESIPYGPFLCLATLVVILAWAAIWSWAEIYFSIGWLVPGVLVACLAAMTVMLLVMRLAREALSARRA